MSGGSLHCYLAMLIKKLESPRLCVSKLSPRHQSLMTCYVVIIPKENIVGTVKVIYTSCHLSHKITIVVKRAFAMR